VRLLLLFLFQWASISSSKWREAKVVAGIVLFSLLSLTDLHDVAYRNLQADSLIYLLKALILASVRPKEKETVPYDEKVRTS
jgi:hypothetical protein